MRRWRACVLAVVPTVLLLQPGQATLARWSDSATVSPSATTAAQVAARPLQCTGNPSVSKDVTWEPFTNHPLESVAFYTASVGGIPAPVSRSGNTYRVTVNLGLVTVLLPVKVTVTLWADTAWAESSTITLGRSLLGLSLGFTCPGVG